MRTIAGLRYRALIGIMVYSFARIGALLAMKVEDIYAQQRRLWARLREKRGNTHAVTCHHNLETYLNAYVEGPASPEIRRGYCSAQSAAARVGRSRGRRCNRPRPTR
jgi:integrase/recombinase XerC